MPVLRTPASCVEKAGLDIRKGLRSLNDSGTTGPNAPARPEGRPVTHVGAALAAEAAAAPQPPELAPRWAPAAPAPGLPPIAEKADDLEAIKKAVDDAAAVGGGLWLSYLFVLFYLAVAAGAVTHADLFFEKPVKLPFLNIELPLLAFFFVAPILFVIVHAYTLVHLVMLTDKAKRFNQALKEQMGARTYLSPEERDRRETIRMGLRRQLPSNIFVQFLAGPRDVRDKPFGYLLRVIAWVTLVVAPLLVLLLFQIQFLPYHSSFITWTQRVALAADLALVWWPWRKILSGREPGPWLGPPWLWADVGLALSAGAVLFSWKAATFPGEWQEELLPSWRILPAMDERGNPATEKDAKGYLRKVFPDWVVNARKVSLHDWLFNAKPDDITRRRFPFSNTLVLPGLNVYEGLGIDDPKKAEWREFVFRARGRDLRGAIFDLASLPKVDFTGADLEGATLSGAQLQNASFVNAQLQDARLDDAHLQGASLKEAQLQGASLINAQLRAASLVGAQLQGASLGGAELQGALLDKAHLEGAALWYAQLQGASLNSAQLQGASLLGASLQGAALDFANLQGATLEYTQLQGASLVDAQLQGALLNSAQLHGASFRDAQLQGVWLYGAKMRGTDLIRAYLWRTRGEPPDTEVKDIKYFNDPEIHGSQCGRGRTSRGCALGTRRPIRT